MIFRRFASIDGELKGAELATTPAKKLALDKRRLRIESGFPVQLHDVNLRQLRLELGRAQKLIRTSPNRTSGGDGSNRMLLLFALPKVFASDKGLIDLVQGVSVDEDATAVYANPGSWDAVQTRDTGGITEADEALRVGSAMRAAEPFSLGRPCVPAPVKVVSIEAERAVRDPRVVHAVLVRANSRCESCGDEAPFVRDDGTPFLEVHHVAPLSDGGSDRQENALACCPNCHRAFHFADDRITRTERAYLENIGLIREL